MTPRVESLLAARLFLSPQVAGDKLYFVSNMSGHLSLYAMDKKGSVPQPLLPPHIALQNPELMPGYLYYVFPELGKILVMVDHNGDEKYQPMFIPLDGGFPEPIFGEGMAGRRIACVRCVQDRNLAYFSVEVPGVALRQAYRADLAKRELLLMAESKWGSIVSGVAEDQKTAILIDGYTSGDVVLYLWKEGEGERALLWGIPMQDRADEDEVPLNGIGACRFTPGNRGLLFVTSIYDDAYGLGYLDLSNPKDVRPVTVRGTRHEGLGEMGALQDLGGTRYYLTYNIDGASWAYEGTFDEDKLELVLDTVLCGDGELSGGVLEDIKHDKASDTYALSFSTATSPTQLYTIGPDRERRQHTAEQVLGIPQEWLAPGEDASFDSHDGMRVSARLYRPAAGLGYDGPRPVVFYIHGGPHSQERPNFAWFSMPLIQFLTLNGFAVFVPNARGSSGYGQHYMKQVDKDWGGLDRLDHVHALTEVLPNDPLIDTKRAAVIGRSYGGYMTLTLAARHPELWAAAVDMFGPTDLTSFVNRLPETWKPYFYQIVGDPVKDREEMLRRSPTTYIAAMNCPMLVIQGGNDPRVTEPESAELVEFLRGLGKQVEYVMFPDEGHDVIKFPNKTRCYNAITEFFKAHLKP